MPASVPTQAEFQTLGKLTTDTIDALAKRVTTIEAEIVKLKTPPSTIYDDFKYTEVFVEGQNSKNLKWHCDFTGGGFARTDGNGLIIAPAGPTLRAVQVKSTQQWADCKFTFDITTEKQTVTSGVQPWMCGWILFRHLDKWRHYYVAIKLNGIEFGKKDAPVGLEPQSEVEKFQKIIWTGGPSTPIGTKRNITILTKGDRFTIMVDGTIVMDLTDVSSFKSGSLSPYSEGSQARYSAIKVENI